MKMKPKKPRLLRVLCVILILAAGYLTVCLGYGPLRYRTFFDDAERLHAYSGLTAGFVPQGMTQEEATGSYLVCGYMDRAQPSRIYVYTPDGNVKCILLQNMDGSSYEGHAGGMTVAGDYVYISNAHKLFLLNKADVLAASEEETLTFRGAIEVPCNASFCSSDGQFLYVGEYHARGYETDATHALTFGDESFAAFVFAYPLSADGSIEKDAVPAYVYVVPDAVQGFAKNGSRIYLSRSSGFLPSSIETYAADGAPDGHYSYAGKDLPYYVLGKARLVRAVSAPHMSEDLEIRNDSLLIGFEAGARKAGFGLLPASPRYFVSFRLHTDF